jgi:hypothetical protein
MGRSAESSAGCSVKHSKRDCERGNSASDKRDSSERGVQEICHGILPNQFSRWEDKTKART